MHESGSGDDADGSQNWRLNLVITTITSVASVIAMTVIIPFLPLFLLRAGVTGEGLIARWSAGIYGVSFLSAAVVAPLWGKLADQYGRKLMLLRSSLGMAIATLLIGFVHTPGQLLAARLLIGLLGGVSSASMMLVASTTPSRHAGFATGILSAGTLCGGLVGPLIGGFLAPAIGLGGLYTGVAAVLFGCFAALAAYLREPPRAGRGEYGGAAATLPLSSRQLAPVLITACLVALATMSIEPLVTLFLLQLGVTPKSASAAAGLAISATALGSAVAAPLIGRLADRIGHRRVIVACLLLAALTVIPQALVTRPWMLIALRLLLGVALGGVMPCIPIIIRNEAPPGRVGQSLSYANTAQYLGQVAGPLLGAMTASLFGLRASFVATAMLLAAGALTNWRMLIAANRQHIAPFGCGARAPLSQAPAGCKLREQKR